MKPAVVRASVHEDLDKELEKYPQVIEHCKALVDKYLDETGLSVDNPEVRIVLPVVVWLDNGFPLDEVVVLEVKGNHFIFTLKASPHTPEHLGKIYA